MDIGFYCFRYFVVGWSSEKTSGASKLVLTMSAVRLPPSAFVMVPLLATLLALAAGPLPARVADSAPESPRERHLFNEGWRFLRGDPPGYGGELRYDLRPALEGEFDDSRDADTPAEEAVLVEGAGQGVLKPWILPTANAFIADPARRHQRPPGHPGSDAPYVRADFDDRNWERVELPHDWAIAGPFNEGGEGVGGGMGRLPSPGIGWYRKDFHVPAEDAGRRVFLEVEGAMSYAMVWLNGRLVGGWPFGYASWQLDLTPHLEVGARNQLAIRLDNPPESSRWYPGGGLFRDVWLLKTSPVRVAQWGTFVTTPEVSPLEATVRLEVSLANDTSSAAEVEVATVFHALDSEGRRLGEPVARLEPARTTVPAGGSSSVVGSVTVSAPRLWGPAPGQKPHLHLAVTEVRRGGALVDVFETTFGIRELRFDPRWGVYVNGERVKLQGVNLHHDLGALGAAFNRRAAERQLEGLRAMGVNAIRMAHNPPASGMLELCDRMGFLVYNESFDVWERKKTPLDFHLIFPDWHEADLRALVRRDRNHPSVIIWSTGNEVGEQYTDEAGAVLGARLREIVLEEDPTRPVTASMNWAKPHMPFPRPMDLISLNYQGEGIRQDPMFEGSDRIRTPPMYPAFHDAFPDRVIVSSETAAALSSRGIYLFPVTEKKTDVVRDGRGADDATRHVSAYELGAVDFGSAADHVFTQLDRHPFVAGEFVWTGWDYLGEPTPYYGARSSYFGIIDLAGFRKDRFYLYQSRWRPEFPMAHLLPHWDWPERVGEVTPVHVFTSGDEAELFLNGRSLGRKVKGPYDYRLRWDDVVYEPGVLEVVAYRQGEPWAVDTVRTTGGAAALAVEPDRARIAADGRDLAFVTVRVIDREGLTVPRATPRLRFRLEGPGEIVATDNGDPTDFTPFPSRERAAFSGKGLVIVRGRPGQPGELVVTVESEGLAAGRAVVHTVE
jgi:beta-galactosidase